MPGDRQSLAVDLAVRGKRKRIQQDKGCRNHVLRQTCAEQRAQLAHQIGRRLLGHDVAHQALVARDVLARKHHHLPYGRVSAEGRFDLPQLDAKAADFHLVINAPEKLDTPVCAESHQITRLVEPRPGLTAERIGDKLLRGHLRLEQILACQSIAPDAQLPVHTDRHRLHVVVQNVHPRVADRSANRNRLIDAALRRHDVTAGKGGVLGRTVPVDEPVLSDHFEHPAHMGNGQRLSPCQQLAHALQTSDLLVNHLVKQRRRQPKRGHAMLLNHATQLL